MSFLIDYELVGKYSDFCVVFTESVSSTCAIVYHP